MNENVVFCSEKNELIVEHLYTVEDYLTYNIQVKSGLFAGASNFCLPKEEVCLLIEKITYIHKELSGNCEIKDTDSDAYIIIETEKLGHISLHGQIGGSHEDHFMKFKYSIDQTVLIGLMQILKKSTL
ncbi:MAG TPA: hypothetical protein VN456_04260 [Desulfosporosinus sp.]|nr:hypothetical protein [Desulfosporosinus sp.]